MLVAGEKAADHMRGLAPAAMDDSGETTALVRFDQAAGADRAKTDIAAQHMRVVARQQHRLAGAHFHGVLPRHLEPP